MDMLKLLAKSLRVIGLLELDHPNGALFAIAIRIIIIITTIYSTMTALWFVMFDGNTFGEIAKASASFLIYVYCLVAYIIFVSNRGPFFEMLKRLESAIENRKGCRILGRWTHIIVCHIFRSEYNEWSTL